MICKKKKEERSEIRLYIYFNKLRLLKYNKRLVIIINLKMFYFILYSITLFSKIT